MLTHLKISNFAIIDHWDVDLKSGLTTVTGESGAGKSIFIDAIELALGARADSNSIRQGAKRAEVTLTFDIAKLPAVSQWLIDHDYDLEDNIECMIRRIINTDGRSKTTINGSPCTLAQVKKLAERLINIHGQHQNQALLNKSHQLSIVDYFANHTSKTDAVKAIHLQWQKTQAKLKSLQQNRENYHAQVELLEYQVSELDEFDLKEDEYQELDLEHKNLANAEHYLNTCYEAQNLLNPDDGVGVSPQLNMILNRLSAMNSLDPKIQNAIELINNAIIQCDECASELEHFIDHFNVDPARLNDVEKRLDTIHQLARKHQVEPPHLFEKHQALAQELNELLNASSHIKALEQEQVLIKEQFHKQAKQLSKSRKTAAKQLCQEIAEKIQILGMKGGQFAIRWHENSDDLPHAHGLETAEFTVSANPGQPLASLSKIASGGEISRIALAIEVIASQTMTTPTLVFDEVDVGIGGNTAAIVGQILRELGQSAQVLCITHQPQVAANGHQHLHVHKITSHNSTQTQISLLDEQTRIDEIARMLGGKTLSNSSVDNAKSLLAEATS